MPDPQHRDGRAQPRGSERHGPADSQAGPVSCCDDALAAATIGEADGITHVALLHEPGIGELHPAVAICGATRRPDHEQADFERTAAVFHAVAARAGQAVLVEADEGNGAALWPVVAELEHVAVEPPLHVMGTRLPALNRG